MNKLTAYLSVPTVVLVVFIVVTQVFTGFYLSSGNDVSAAYTFLYPLVFTLVIAWWLRQDMGKRDFKGFLDWGLLLYVAWLLVVPYYLLKTRGIKGLIPIVVFIVLYIGAFLAGIMLYAAFGS